MTLTPQDIRSLRDIAVRALNEACDVLVAAARREGPEVRRARPPIVQPQASSPQSEPPPHRFAYTIAEASRILGVGRSSLYTLIARGELKAVRVLSRRLIEAREIEALLAKARAD